MTSLSVETVTSQLQNAFGSVKMKHRKGEHIAEVSGFALNTPDGRPSLLSAKGKTPEQSLLSLFDKIVKSASRTDRDNSPFGGTQVFRQDTLTNEMREVVYDPQKGLIPTACVFEPRS